MKQWNAFIQDIKDKVGISPKHPSSLSDPFSAEWAAAARADGISSLASKYGSESGPAESERRELELDFRRCWDYFLSSRSEKEKEVSLSMMVDIFCILVKQQADVGELLALLTDSHLFLFAIGKSFVADIEKFRVSKTAKSLHTGKILSFLSGLSKDVIRCGSSFLFAVEVLVLAPIDKQPLLDSGILSCLVHVLNAVVNPNDATGRQMSACSEDLAISGKACDENISPTRYLEIEESIVHIMKILAGNSCAALKLAADDSLQILFEIVAKGSLVAFSQFKQGLLPLRIVQLHRHAMQILSLLLLNDNGSVAKYIQKYHLIKILLMAVKDFSLEDGDSAYTVGIVDLLLECVEMSYRPGSSISLKEDIRNAHGYQFLVQFALTLSCSKKTKVSQSEESLSSEEKSCSHDVSIDKIAEHSGFTQHTSEMLPSHLSSSLSRLLDILASLAQTGLKENVDCSDFKRPHSASEIWEKGNEIQDLEAIQMLQDIFLKCDNVEVQAEVLDILFKIFSSHLNNYKLCQQLRTVPLFILNMAYFPWLLQERVLKILDYAVAVVDCVPEQELLSLCCLLQQPISSYLQEAIVSFFVKLISFDYQYKKVLREIGLLEILIDDLKQHRFLSKPADQLGNPCSLKERSCSEGFMKHLDDKDTILSSPKLLKYSFARLSLFEEENSIAVAWDCLHYLLKKDKSNQALFRSKDGLFTVLPFLVLDTHRLGALRLMSCLVIEDTEQAHPEEVGMLIETLKSGMVVNQESEYKLSEEAVCDILGTLWRILGANYSVQRVFGEATGFSLLLTTFYSIQTNGQLQDDQMFLEKQMKIFTCMLRVITAAVLRSHNNRSRLHAVISSQAFTVFLKESGLICVDWEKQVVQLLLELALEVVVPPASGLQTGTAFSSYFLDDHFIDTGNFGPERERVYNAGVVRVLIHILLDLSSDVQVELLAFIEKLASGSPFNQESLTSAGCVGLLLSVVNPFLKGSSPLLVHALRIIEILGAYRLSTLEIRELVRYTLEMKTCTSGYYLVDMMEKLIQRQDTKPESVSMAPFLEMDLSRSGHASIQASLGERTWPPVAGYSFACWFKYCNFSKGLKENQLVSCSSTGRYDKNLTDENIMRIFTVSAIDDVRTSYVEISLAGTGTLTLATNSSSSLSCYNLELEEGHWHHLAIVHSKPSVLAGLFQSSVAYLYLNGKLRCSGNLGYSPSPVGKPLQVTIGTHPTHAKVSNFSWSLRNCYLFEEVITAGSICFMYILGRGYRGIFQDRNLLKFVPAQACGGDKLSILDLSTVDSTTTIKHDNSSGNKNRTNEAYGSNFIWDVNMLGNLSAELVGRKLIFAFDGTSLEVQRASGRLSMLNLVDPKSTAASPFGGIPRFGLLNGDSYVCNQYVIGNCLRAVGGMTVILALVEAAKTRDMLHMALTLLACALHQNPQNVLDMQACRGYHLLAIFLQRRMQLFDIQSLDIFFQIATCEASCESESYVKDQTAPSGKSTENPKKNLLETPNCIIISNLDMVEHVLLDWTLWVTAPVSIQIALVGFLEQLVSLHWYRYYNLMRLRQINLVQHLLVILQRDDVEVQVLEKIVILLSVILEDGFQASDLDLVVRFLTITFKPPEITSQQIIRETMGKHVIVRNLLLEMLIDLHLTITSEELLEQWYDILSLKFIMHFLDGYVHPTSMTWIMTLLGVCLASSPTFDDEFRGNGGYHVLTYVLSNYVDLPDIYYIIFSLIFGKAIYPPKRKICMEDFHDLMPNDGYHAELKFVELLDSVISMAKHAFTKLIVQSMLAEHDSLPDNVDTIVRKQGISDIEIIQSEIHGSSMPQVVYGGEAAAPCAATFIMRFMVDLSKMCPPFSAICRRRQFLENCVDLYFTCVRAHCALKMAKDTQAKELQEIIESTEQIQVVGDESYESIRAEHFAEKCAQNMVDEQYDDASQLQDSINRHSAMKYADESTIYSGKLTEEELPEPDEERSKQNLIISSPVESKNKRLFVEPSINSSPARSIDSTNKSSSATALLSPSPVLALASWLGSKGNSNGMRPQFSSRTLAESQSSETSKPTELWGWSRDQQSLGNDTVLSISAELIVEIDNLTDARCFGAAGATATLDFISIILSDIVSEQSKASYDVEKILESIPLDVVVETALVFQGLCLSRIMTFLERRLLRDEEEGEKRLDKGVWSVNLGALCWMIVDRVYMGSFPQPASVSRALEFVLSMLQLANKDGCIERAIPSGRGLLARSRGTKQLDTYLRALLKSANRLIMYCFLPSFLIAVGEDDFLTRLGFHTGNRKSILMKTSQNDSNTDVVAILQLLFDHKHLLLCPSNLDTDLICCLCVNLIYLLRDERQVVQSLSMDIMKYLLLHRRAALEELLAVNPYQGINLNVLDGGFDILLEGNLSPFFDWFRASEQIISIALDQCAALMWTQYIGGSAKFPGVRIKGMEVRREKEMRKKITEASESDFKQWEQKSDLRKALLLVRNSMKTKLKVVCQNKYGWILHAESEWQNHLQQLVHERGIMPLCISSQVPGWKLCPIEGPYRMRKKLIRCKISVDSIPTFLKTMSMLDDRKPAEEVDDNAVVSLSHFDLDSNSLSNGFKHSSIDGGDYGDSSPEVDECLLEEPLSAKSLNGRVSSGDQRSTKAISDTSINESVPTSPTPMHSSQETREKPADDGEYLIRPYLEPQEKICFKYNCERVVGLDKHDGIFLIGESCLYIIENFYIDELGRINEKQTEGQISVIDRALGVVEDVTGGGSNSVKNLPSLSTATNNTFFGGRAWASVSDGWEKDKIHGERNVPHSWNIWKHENVHELFKRDYQLRPVAIEIFSIDGCNDLLVFHKRERDEVFKVLVSMNLPPDNIGRLVSTVSGLSLQENNEGSRLSRLMAKTFCKRWQNGELSNFEYIMHLNTIAGRGYNDLTQYPVFPWVLSDYESEILNLTNPETFRKFDKPMGCQTADSEEEFKNRFEVWDDPDIPKFHYGSHYSSAGIVLFYLLRLPPFSSENQNLQGGQFDRADRLFTSIRDTWLSAIAKDNTSDVKELIPEFFYLPEFLENRFNLNLGVKQSGEKVGDVVLPPWAKGSTREFIRKHREALECEYVSQNLHHWIDLIFGYKQRGKAAEEAVNVFYHYTYEGNVDIDSVSDPAMKASILAQINHFGQTPKQLFFKPHPKHRMDVKPPIHPLCHCSDLVPYEIRKYSTPISQIVHFHEKILIAGKNTFLKPSSYSECIVWGFPDCSLRVMTYDQDRVLSTHESLHGGSQIHCGAVGSDGQILVTGGDDGVVTVWVQENERSHSPKQLHLKRALCSHTAKIACVYVSQSYKLIASGSEDCSVILWDLSSLEFVKELAKFAEPVSAVYINDLTGDIVTAAGILLAVWSVNGDCLAFRNTSQLPSDIILSVTTSTFSDWQDTDWYATGHQSGSIKVWNMVHSGTDMNNHVNDHVDFEIDGFSFSGKLPEYKLVLERVLRSHNHPVTAVHLTPDLKQLLSGDSAGNLLSWILPDENVKASSKPRPVL